MARYKYQQHLQVSDHQVFDTDHEPEERVLFAGIYRCQGCGKEVAISRGESLPTEMHHPHPVAHGEARWRLLVLAV